jgi:hypothetical protein
MRCFHTCWQQVAGRRNGPIIRPLIKSESMAEFAFSYRRFPAKNPTSETLISRPNRATETGPFPWNPNTNIPAPMVAVTSWT